MNRLIYTIAVILIFCITDIFATAATPFETPKGWASYSVGTTGGSGGSYDTVNTLTELNALLAQSGSLIVFVKGTISGSVSVAADNKSLLGLPGAKIYGSLHINNRKNIIVRNLTIQGLPCSTYDSCKGGDDAVHIQGSKHVWMDHLDVMDGQDGNMDCNDTADFITVSWCKFSYTDSTKQHKFSNLIGSADSLSECEGKLNVTFHHCWWTNWVNQRQPRTRYGKIHVVNNFFNSDSSSYCSNAGYHTSVMIEKNVYLNQKNPISPDGNTYGCTSRGNIFTGCSGDTSGSGTAFEPSSYYDTSFIDPAAGIESAVISDSTGAGATLKWTDKVYCSYSVIMKNLHRKIAFIYWKKGGIIYLRNISGQKLTVTLCDISGRILQETVCKASGTEVNLSVSGYSSHVYILHLKSNGAQGTYSVFDPY